MESLYLLVPVAIIFVVIAVRIFFWAINSGQYDDLNTEGHRILFDDNPSKPTQKVDHPEVESCEPVEKNKGVIHR